jgi:hypothetical protein
MLGLAQLPGQARGRLGQACGCGRHAVMEEENEMRNKKKEENKDGYYNHFIPLVYHVKLFCHMSLQNNFNFTEKAACKFLKNNFTNKADLCQLDLILPRLAHKAVPNTSRSWCWSYAKWGHPFILS